MLLCDVAVSHTFSRISFFAVPILGESQATRYLSQMLRDPECILEQLASGPNASFPPVSLAGRNTTSSQSLMDARTRIYEIMVRETTPIDARTQLYGESLCDARSCHSFSEMQCKEREVYDAWTALLSQRSLNRPVDEKVRLH